MYRNKIRKYRKERRLTLKELAEKSGISAGYLSHLENGSRDNPSMEVMENISIILNKSITDTLYIEPMVK